MKKQKYSSQQVSIALLYSALSLEYYMNETHHVYTDANGIFPEWEKTFVQLLNWSLEESRILGLGSDELEKWGDELLVEDFKSIADLLVAKNQIIGGKLAFLAVVLCYVLETYIPLPGALGTQQAVLLLAQLKKYLQEKWQTDLDSGIINPELNSFHVPMARDFARRWQSRLELLANEAS